MAHAANINRVNILGVGVSALTLDLARQVIVDALRQRRQGYICVTEATTIVMAQDDPELRTVLNDAFLCTPDGMPIVWLCRLAGQSQVRRVYGPDLMLTLCQLPGIRHFFYGGTNGLTTKLQEKLSLRFPGLQVVGTFEPPFRPLRPEEEQDLIAQVRQARPDVFWVGLGAGKQDKFMAQWLPRLDVTLMVGVGAAFAFHSGQVKQAPRWIRHAGFEWLYRLCREPQRLWRRVLRVVPRFAFLACCQKLGLKSYPLAASR
jgi:N-acetylglucosaminyldiphosphoundecaprenol N-acetyl-beta-D-mannosaminyltransferase